MHMLGKNFSLTLLSLNVLSIEHYTNHSSNNNIVLAILCALTISYFMNFNITNITKICSYFVSYSSSHDYCTIAACTQVGWALNMYVYNVILWITKPEPNMLKIVLIIPSSTSQKFTQYSYFIPIPLATYYSHIILLH